MPIEIACATILGDEAADRIIGEQGIRWAIVAAMAAANASHDPRAIASIRSWNADARARHQV